VAFLDTNHQRAALLLLLLGAALFVALTPFATGLLGIPVLYVIFQPVQGWFARRLGPRTSAVLVVAIALFLIVVPGVSFAGLVATQGHAIASGMVESPILAHLSTLRLGGVAIGPHLADLGTKLVGWLANSAFGLIGTATRLVLNLTIALFGLYFLLLRPAATWVAVSPYIPFSADTKEKLRTRFRNVTTATLVGTGLTALIQGTLVGLGFWVTGLPHALFWGAVTVVFSILPVVGCAMVWGPGVLALALDQHYGGAIGLAAEGILIVGNVEYVIRSMAFRRWARTHPLTTLVGALAGLPYFGILGLLIGPLALSYFLELSRMYREEYLEGRPA
jgi:predicted PurR-regulated permease PerM